jgi:hypothetical protein
VFFTHRSFYAQWRQKLQFQSLTSAPTRKKKNDFEALIRRKNKKEMDHRQIFFKQSDESPSQP